MDEQVTIARAREHIEAGGDYLQTAENAGLSITARMCLATMASAHFAAASAIANALPADEGGRGIPEDVR